MRLFIDFWGGEGAWTALPRASREQFLRVGRKVFHEVTSLGDDRTPASAYAGWTMPTLLLTGEASPLAARRVIERLERAFPRATRVVVPGAGHMGPLTAGDVVDPLIAAHVRGA